MKVNNPEMVAAHLTAAIVHGRISGDRSTMNKTVTVKETVETYLECLEELKQSQKRDDSDEEEEPPSTTAFQTAVTVVSG
jgi:hypothetical protein